MIRIDILNESSLADDVVSAFVPALQAQVSEDFAPLWGIDAVLSFVPKGGSPSPGAWWQGIFDTSDQPGALGYHDLTSEGLPFGKTFAATDAKYGEDWRTTLSHETLEQLLDPFVNLVAFFQTTGRSGTLVAYEVSDPVQGDTYEKLGAPVSNFVAPAYFEPGAHAAGTKYDFLGLLSGEFPALRPGGYYSYFDVARGGGWKQATGETVPFRKRRPHAGSRRELRGVDHDERRRSSRHG